MFYELNLKVYVKEDVHYQKSLEKLGNWINESMLEDDTLRSLHGEKGYKGYAFGNLYPAESSKYYREGKLYEWFIRSVNKKMLEKLVKVLDESEHFKKVVGMVTEIKIDFIDELYSVTPVMVSSTDGSPLIRGDVLDLKERLNMNGVKKAKAFGHEVDENHDWIQGIEVLNRKGPDVTFYKGKKMLGYKYRVFVNGDQDSQVIANVVLGSGLGEKNTSMGSGFVLSRRG